MARDNMSRLFEAGAARPMTSTDRSAAPSAASGRFSSSFNDDGSLPSRPSSQIDAESPYARNLSTSVAINGKVSEPERCKSAGDVNSDGNLLVGFVTSTENAAASTHTQPPTYQTKPGVESLQYIKKFGSNIGSMALKPLLELQLAEKMNSMNDEIEEMQQDKEVSRLRRQLEAQDRERQTSAEKIAALAEQSEQLTRELEEKEEEDECERIKMEGLSACERIGRQYDALVKFTNSCPHGTYEEFVEFLLMGGGRTANDDGRLEDFFGLLAQHDFYGENSEYRRLWNDNLTLGLPQDITTLEGRVFVPSSNPHQNEPLDPHTHSTQQRQRTFSEEERIRNLGQTLLSEGEKIKKQISHVDRTTIKQGLGSAVNVLSNVTSFALKPLRDLQLAEKLNAMNIDAQEEEARKELEEYNRMQEDKRDMEEMMRLKKEAEESCMNATKEHLLEFILASPNATFEQWIEELHPENAHDGTLLEGLGKTIDHRFFVEESDHRRLWNAHLFTFPERTSPEGRKYVPARARQMDESGEMVVAADILSGSVAGGDDLAKQCNQQKSGDGNSSDLIAFDW